jgi:uncharacterized phage protein gp47/JayE
MAKKTFSNIVNSMISYIKGVKPTLDTSEGTILNDVVINAPSQELAKLYNELDLTSQSQNIFTAPAAALEGLGSNLGLVRRSARQAKGYVKFFSFTLPTFDINIAAGTVVSTVPTSSNTSQRFITTTSVTMYKVLASTYLNSDLNVYEIEVPIVAVNAGVDGVVGAQTITSLITPVTGVSGCYNENPTTGGADEEDSESFRNRIAIKWKGSSIGTINGLLSDVLIFSDDIIDAKVVGHEDVGREDAGAIDVYIKGIRNTSNQEVFTTYDLVYDDITLSKQPVISSSPISLILSNSGAINSADYELLTVDNEYKGSVRAVDKISWITPPPASSGSLIVTYSYNSLVSDLQSYLWREDKLIQNTDVLVKWATEIPVDLTITIKVLPGYDQNTVISNIQQAIALFFSELNIGEEVQQADIAREILNVNGVDDLFLPFNTFKSHDNTIIPDSFNNLVIPFNSYIVANIITINVV